MTKNKNLEFSDFLEYFPEIELPVTLTDETIYDFSKNNPILPAELSDKFLSPYLGSKDEAFREFIPCFKIPDTTNFHALVFWEGGLLTYEYNLICFDNKGNFIQGKVLAGTIADKDSIKKSVATIDPDWMIYIVAGESGKDEFEYEASKSRAFNMELLANGEIIFSLDD